MNDTSLISSATDGQTSNNADDVNTEDQTTNGEDNTDGGKGDIIDKMYDKTPDNTKEGEGDDASDTEGSDRKTDEGGDDKSEQDKEGDKDADKDDGDSDKDADEDKDDGDEEPGEPLDLSDMEFDLPEGMELNKEVLGDLGDLAGELGIKSKEDAAKFVPLGVKLVENAFAKQQEQFAETRSEWRDEVAADKEIGGADEKARKEKLVVADRGLEQVGSPELRTLLNQTGLGDHPEVIRAFYKVGLATSEDVVETGGSGDTAPGGLDALYPTMAEKK